MELKTTDGQRKWIVKELDEKKSLFIGMVGEKSFRFASSLISDLTAAIERVGVLEKDGAIFEEKIIALEQQLAASQQQVSRLLIISKNCCNCPVAHECDEGTSAGQCEERRSRWAGGGE